MNTQLQWTCFLVVALWSQFAVAAEPAFEIIASAEDGLHNPFGVTFDSAGNLYIVEYQGGRIWKKTSDGKLLKIAGRRQRGFAGDGGPLADAVFSGMHNAVCTADDQLYISDTRNNRIRMADLNTGIITTVAGTGKAGFLIKPLPAVNTPLNDPISISLDQPRQRLLIADINNHRIRALDFKTDRLIDLAGNGVRKVPEDGADARLAPLVDPRGCDVDAQGNLYILERSGHALRVVDPAGKIRTVAGTGEKGDADGPALQASLNGPKHLCIDQQNRVIIADAENHLIRLYDPQSQQLTTILGREEKLNRPHGVTIHDGSLYICDSWNDRVLKMNWPADKP